MSLSGKVVKQWNGIKFTGSDKSDKRKKQLQKRQEPVCRYSKTHLFKFYDKYGNKLICTNI